MLSFVLLQSFDANQMEISCFEGWKVHSADSQHIFDKNIYGLNGIYVKYASWIITLESDKADENYRQENIFRTKLQREIKVNLDSKIHLDLL